MKTTKKLSNYGLLGLLGALALNMSIVWVGTTGSQDEASKRSRYDDLATCLSKVKNDAKLDFDCDVGDSTINVKAKKKSATYTFKSGTNDIVDKSGVSTSTNGVAKSIQEVINARNGSQVVVGDDGNQIATERRAVDDYILEIDVVTEAADGGFCSECEVNKRLSAFQGQFDDISDIKKEIRDAYEESQDNLDDFEEKLAKDEEIEDGYKMCENDRNGREFRNERAERTCMRRQLRRLKGSELTTFLNSVLMPQALNALATGDTETFNKMYGWLSSYRSGTRFAAFDTLRSARRDIQNRYMLEQQVSMETRFLPREERREAIREALDSYDLDVAHRINQVAMMRPELAPMLQDTERVVVHGKSPLSGGIATGALYTRNDRGTRFGRDLARNSIGLRDDDDYRSRRVPSNLRSRRSRR